MKTFGNVMKVLATIAAIIGIVYVVAAYGDKIVSWAKRLLNSLLDKRTRFFDIEEQMEEDEIVVEEAPAAEAAAEA
ncbi:MAG: hypothetical protein IKA47_08545 [Oscillospiraceae bacterium]|nr:hypothetical protein [Oscillospiraceae bacterium]